MIFKFCKIVFLLLYVDLSALKYVSYKFFLDNIEYIEGVDCFDNHNVLEKKFGVYVKNFGYHYIFKYDIYFTLKNDTEIYAVIEYFGDIENLKKFPKIKRPYNKKKNIAPDPLNGIIIEYCKYNAINILNEIKNRKYK